MTRKYGRNWVESTEQKANKQRGRKKKRIAFGIGISEKILPEQSAAPDES